MPVVDSRISTVTLYQQGARVTRVVTLDCKDGVPPSEIEIAPLPLALFDPMVRVRVVAVDGKDAEVVATNVRVALFVPARDLPTLSVDEKRLQQVEREIQGKQDTLDQLRQEQQALKSIPVPERPESEEGAPPPPSPMAARVALEEFAEAGVQARVKEIGTLEDALLRLQEERDAAAQALALASSARELRAQDVSKSVVATLKKRGGPVTRVELHLEYFVPGARWAPAYQCRMTRDCRQAELVMRALICQRTGEDWKGARLILSTAAPMSWTELPELSAIRIGRAQPAPAAKAGFRPPPIGAAALFQDFDRDRSRFALNSPAVEVFSAPLLDASVEVQKEMPTPRVQRSLAKKAKAPRRDVERRTSGAMPEEMADEGEMPEMELATPSPAMMAPPPPPAPSAGMGPPGAPPMMKMAAPARASRAEKGGASLDDTGPTQRALEMVVFTHLRLAAPDDAGHRNRLMPVDARRQYVESLTRFNVTVSIDVMQVIQRAEYDAATAALVPLPPGAVDVKGASGNFDFTYTTENPVDVPSDGTFHSVPVGSRTAEASVVYVAVPREDSHVYRQAMVKNPLPSPLLGGPAEVYVAGEFVLGTSLPTVAPKGELKLGLGVEQAIKVARNTSYKEQRSGTKIVATSELLHGITIEVVNNLEREIDCEVRERIPQPAANAEVVVEESNVSPEWKPYTQDERNQAIEGGRRWRIKVAANDRQTLKAEYVVKLYANNELVGGNRREA